MKILIIILVLIVILLWWKDNRPPKNPNMDPSQNCPICDGHGCMFCGGSGNKMKPW